MLLLRQKVGVKIGDSDGIESFYLIVDNSTSLHTHSHPIDMSIMLLDKVFTIDLKAMQLTMFESYFYVLPNFKVKKFS